jgi:hypothetical protein
MLTARRCASLNARRLVALAWFVVGLAGPLKDSAADSEVAQPTAAVSTVLPIGGIPAFPTAQGYGATSKGGRGGKIIEVTNLGDSGPGSLRAAIKAKGPRIVVFKVAGYIDLQTDLVIKNPYITIAGQTAPGDGTCITGRTLRIKTHDVVIRHFCSRPGDRDFGTRNRYDNRDAYGIEHAQNVILDHVSGSWSLDEVITVWFKDTSDFTIQWSLFGEPLASPLHSKGGHPMGVLVGPYVSRGSFHHNLLVSNGFRNPRIAGASNIDFVNNVVYHWGKKGAEFANGHGSTQPNRVNIISNIYERGPGRSSTPPFFFDRNLAPGTGIYLEGNEDLSGTNLDRQTFSSAGAPYSQHIVLSPAVPVYDMEPAPAKNIIADVIDNAGRTAPRRDAVDARLARSVKQGTSAGSRRDLAAVGGYPPLALGTAYVDGDRDGMSDVWEISHDLDANDPTDGKLDDDNDGYTNVEEFLNQLAGDPPTSIELAP